ncbi:uncharacterized protein PHACADRAFT_262548 [Phanerochaete carnosa HHB-10118-sp]|uniref:Uncharacterized protein n=1 Tax=Phanerochaete carnosa (strain HHB-10118-sp) TaxID=650164 RepID=K5VZN6_PHACS|nr:uncharacterized protein PHACADRAFT_262548 [Phanerochaete carnosa HHB-10118-sp]EKM52084.1 hypothetical protein PHACADRAFT_262548 [Phanerochaete carnosa HHB-10118-sp]
MFPLVVSLLSLLFLAASSLSAPTTQYGTITAPASGTAVMPGANFTFSYFPHADYGISSFAYQVWLLAVPAAAGGVEQLSFSTPGVSGYYFGRFDYPNYPAVPYAQNPAPPQLTMPDFSKMPAGWAAGETASNLSMQLTVVEEWGDSTPTVGRQLSVASAIIMYNATSTA